MFCCEGCLNKPICKYCGYADYLEGKIRESFVGIVKNGGTFYHGDIPVDDVFDASSITCKYRRTLPVSCGDWTTPPVGWLDPDANCCRLLQK